MEYMSALRNEIDDQKPSLFEILSENQLSDLIAPSLRYLLAVATHRHPRYLLRALNSFDELYALIGLIVERYYLKTFGGSFTENFYGLKRERVLRTKNGEVLRAQLGAAAPVRESLKLKEVDVWKNVAVIVGIPYLKRKLDESYDIHIAPSAALASSGGGYRPDESLPSNPTVKQRLMHYYKWFLRNVYPSLNGAYYFSILAFSLAYLFDNTKFSSPFLWLIGTRIRRLGPADHAAIEAALQPASAAAKVAGTRPGQGWRRYINANAVHAPLLKSLKMILPASIFALKFLEWWHASDFSRQLARKATEALDLPPPVISGLPTASLQSQPATKSERSRHSQSLSMSTTSSSRRQQDTDSSSRPLKPKRSKPPLSSKTYLPIFTVPYPPPTLSNPSTDFAQAVCPICLDTLVNPTACQTGFVFCYTCIFRWMNGEHDRQQHFMRGESIGAPWDEDDRDLAELFARAQSSDGEVDGSTVNVGGSREGKWESGKGRCPVTGQRVLGGTEGLRRPPPAYNAIANSQLLRAATRKQEAIKEKLGPSQVMKKCYVKLRENTTRAMATNRHSGGLKSQQKTIGSSTWIANEKENVRNLLETEMEEAMFPVQYEIEWLNEHMAGIFGDRDMNVAEIFQTPWKLRGRTPATARKYLGSARANRAPLNDVFATQNEEVPSSTLSHAIEQLVEDGSHQQTPTPAVNPVTQPRNNEGDEDDYDNEDNEDNDDIEMLETAAPHAESDGQHDTPPPDTVNATQHDNGLDEAVMARDDTPSSPNRRNTTEDTFHSALESDAPKEDCLQQEQPHQSHQQRESHTSKGSPRRAYASGEDEGSVHHRDNERQVSVHDVLPAHHTSQDDHYDTAYDNQDMDIYSEQIGSPDDHATSYTPSPQPPSKQTRTAMRHTAQGQNYVTTKSTSPSKSRPRSKDVIEPPTSNKQPQVLPRQDLHNFTTETREETSESGELTPERRPYIRKSSLSFASLPAREPLTKISIGSSRASTAKHSQEFAKVRPTPSSPVAAQHQSQLQQQPEGNEDEPAIRPQKSSTQLLHERISMLGKSHPPRPTKSITSSAMGSVNHVSYPDLGSTSRESDRRSGEKMDRVAPKTPHWQMSPSQRERGDSTTTRPVSRASPQHRKDATSEQAQPRSPYGSSDEHQRQARPQRPISMVEVTPESRARGLTQAQHSLYGRNDEGRGAGLREGLQRPISMIDTSLEKRPLGTSQPSPVNKHSTFHTKSNLIVDTSSPSRNGPASVIATSPGATGRKTQSNLSNERITPPSPLRPPTTLPYDGPFSASKMKLQSIMRSAKGLLTLTHASDNVKKDALPSPRSPRRPVAPDSTSRYSRDRDDEDDVLYPTLDHALSSRHGTESPTPLTRPRNQGSSQGPDRSQGRLTDESEDGRRTRSSTERQRIAKELERRREMERERLQKEREARIREEEERERRQREQREREIEKRRELERQRQREIELEEQRERELELERERERERERQRVLELEQERERQRERERERERELERQRELEVQLQLEREREEMERKEEMQRIREEEERQKLAQAKAQAQVEARAQAQAHAQTKRAPVEKKTTLIPSRPGTATGHRPASRSVRDHDRPDSAALDRDEAPRLNVSQSQTLPSRAGTSNVAKPTRNATTKTRPTPLSIRVGTLSTQRIPLSSSTFVNPAESSNSSTVPHHQQPLNRSLKKKPSTSTLHSSTTGFKNSTSSSASTAKTKAALAAEKRKQQEEARQQEVSRVEAERREREREKLVAEDPKKLAHKQAIEKRRMEVARKMEQQRNGTAAGNEKPVLSVPRGEAPAARPPSRYGGIAPPVPSSRPSGYPLVINPAKPPKRPLDGEGAPRPAVRKPSVVQQIDGKKRRTDEEMEQQQQQQQQDQSLHQQQQQQQSMPVRPTMAPPTRPSQARKMEAAKQGYSGHPAHSGHSTYKNSLAGPGPRHFNPVGPSRPANAGAGGAASTGHPLDMAKYAHGKIPFADANNSPNRRTLSTKISKSSPAYQNGETISLPEIPTDSEDEDSDVEPYHVPDWAKPENLHHLLVEQEGRDGERVFGPTAPLHMEEIFKDSKNRHRFRERTSSANWNGPDGLTQDEIRADIEAREKMKRNGGWMFGI
ncbi:ubiquitin-protein ligase peroxin 12 [Ascosphaera aggregata]|nr:ubiquitin-protein ligase peroxin 12 [Ascosphaera aggregata]